jgi:NADH-quinone oxidoreductase subunit M
MEFIMNHLLTLILFSPVAVAIVVILLPREEVKLQRWVAFLGSLIPLALSIVLWFAFNPDQPGFQFQERYVWYEPINSSFHVGVDGISLTMVLLTTLLTPLAILASYTIKDRVNTYMFFFLMLEMGMLGVFLSLDLLIFFVFL